MSDRRLHLLLSKVRRRVLIIGGTAGVLWGLAAASCVLLASVWLDLLWELSPPLRISAAASAVLAIATAIVLLGAKSLRAAQESLAVRRLDQAGRYGGSVVSGWELSSPMPPDPRQTNLLLTAGLATLAVDQATRLAERVPTSQVVSLRPARNAATTVAVIAGALGVLALCMPTLARVEWQRFSNPYGDVPPFSHVRFHVEPGDTQVTYGSALHVHVTVEGAPVERVELVFENVGGAEEVLAMFPETGDKWRATLAKIDEPATYFVRAERARSRRYNIGVITVPQIASVRFQVTSPAYTREADYQGLLPKEGIVGLAGTKVSVWAKSNRPLSGGTIDVTGAGKSVPVRMLATAPVSDEVMGQFVIHENGKFNLYVVDTDGQSSQDSFGGTITLLVDERPFVRLLQPRAMSLATPEANLPITVAAEDDYGLARLQLFRSLNNSRPLPLDLKIEDPPPRRVQEKTYLPLSEYGLSPGDEIKLFARVEDNDPAGRKGAESAVATVRIISQEDFERMLRARQGLQVLMSKYQQAQRRIEKLAEQVKSLEERLAKLPPDSAAAEEVRAELRQLAKQLREEARAIEESAKHLLPYDLDKNLTDQLQQLAKNLEQAAKSLEALDSEPGLSHKRLADELAELTKRLSESSSKHKKEATEPLEHLALIYPLLEDESKFVILVMRQRDLAERMAALKGHDGEDNPALKARMRDLEEEQSNIREDLHELLGAIEDHVARLPDDPQLDELRRTATEFVEAVRGSRADETLSDAATALAEFSGTRAYEKATEAAEILEKFLSKCQGMGKACKGCLAFNPGLANGLGNTIEQLLAEAGLGSGPGFGLGEGAGGGYSARSSNMNNVGLYGGLPALGPEGSGTGTGDFGPGPTSGGSLGGSHQSDKPTLVDSAATGNASGAGQAAIPLRYRQRVGQYLQRLAEELEK